MRPAVFLAAVAIGMFTFFDYDVGVIVWHVAQEKAGVTHPSQMRTEMWGWGLKSIDMRVLHGCRSTR